METSESVCAMYMYTTFTQVHVHVRVHFVCSKEARVKGQSIQL